MTKQSKALMFQGTGSDVGKTVLVAGLCRAAKNRGIRVAPFKPQNMSNNAAVASPDRYGDFGEMGRAQWLQAMACGIEPSVHMNPILLKPQSEIGSQIIVQGKVTGSAKARDYFRLKPTLLDAVLDSFHKIGSEVDLVLVEGAGSPAEINLRSGDIANMGFAEAADLPVVLIGDIDRGGVIASIVGTHTILTESDRSHISGYVINKFRGDVSLFEEGLRLITGFTGWSGYGILPWLDVVRRLPAEDSVALDSLFGKVSGGVKIAVPVLGKIANFDDLDPLMAEEAIDLVFVRKGEPLPKDAALIILPGSKSTISDLEEFRSNGWDRGLQHHVDAGKSVIGICGGLQILGKSVSDPLGLEGDTGAVEGLGYLCIETELVPEKSTVNNLGHSQEFDLPISGYEIHMGRTTGEDCSRPMVSIDGRPDGAMSLDGLVQGCYMHGLFHNDGYRQELLAKLGATSSISDFRSEVDAALDELAAHLENHLDVDGLLALAR